MATTEIHKKPNSNPSTPAATQAAAPARKPLTDEQKRKLGKELAVNRVQKCLALMKKIGNLGRYGLPDEDITKIITAMQQRFDAMKANINQKVVKEEGFSL